MLIQSSFLIRCWLDSSAQGGAVRRYRIEHVQSGKHFDATLFSEIEAWMEETNRVQLAEAVEGVSNEEPSV